MSEKSAIEMFVVGIVIDPRSQSPVVVLKNEGGDKYLPIWVGIPEATSIAEALKQIETTRPLTHDLMQSALDQLGARVDRVVITELKESTYISELVISQNRKSAVLDARPSDSIAMAIRSSAPIYVLEHVLEQAQLAFQGENALGSDTDRNTLGDSFSGEPQISDEEMSGLEEGAEDATNEESVEIEEDVKFAHRDFRTIDQKDWEEILKKLNPDDFNYEM